MKRKQGLAALVAGTFIVLGLLVVFAIELSDNQATSRHSLESQAIQRASWSPDYSMRSSPRPPTHLRQRPRCWARRPSPRASCRA